MFTHIAIHTPKPEHRDDVIASMQQAGAAGDGAEGLLQMGSWQEIDGGRLVGLAIWESREAFLAAAPGIFAAVGDDQFDEVGSRADREPPARGGLTADPQATFRRPSPRAREFLEVPGELTAGRGGHPPPGERHEARADHRGRARRRNRRLAVRLPPCLLAGPGDPVRATASHRTSAAPESSWARRRTSTSSVHRATTASTVAVAGTSSAASAGDDVIDVGRPVRGRQRWSRRRRDPRRGPFGLRRWRAGR